MGESLITGIEQYQRVTQEREYNEKTRHSMAQAMEVQQYLIPKSNPDVDGLDIAGKCIFCDETGGDYYDFLDRGRCETGKICVVAGQIIVISTDGICEAPNSDGEMFGKSRLRRIIRENAAKPAQKIVSAVMHDFQQFIHPMSQKDDATLVVIKVDS